MEKKEIAKSVALSTTQINKSINSLMGIISGLVCDDELNELEIRYLNIWCEENRRIANEYPANVIFRRVHEILLDKMVTDEERLYLLNDLKTISGNHFSETGAALPEHIESIFDDDPLVIFPQNEFVFTGGFLYGTRAACERAVLQRKGQVNSSITQRTNYLVVGSRASPDWIAENFGKKIQKAVSMAESGEYEIAIIREVDWVMSLK